MKRAVLVLVLAGCGGRIADASVGESDSCLPADACRALGLEPLGRSSFPCPDGGLAYVCCGYTDAELEKLSAQGDVLASHCLSTPPAHRLTIATGMH